MRKNALRGVVLAALFAALICLCSLIGIPLFQVYITLQSFAIFCALFMLGGGRGCVAILIYITLGVVGLPVFAGFRSGIGAVFDASGGFIFGFLAAGLFYWLITALFSDKRLVKIIAAVLSHIIIYAFGSLWYMLVYTSGKETFLAVICVTVLPFILTDIIKLALAFVTSEKIKKHVKF